MIGRRPLAALILTVAGVTLPREAQAVFRGDEVEDRSFEYTGDYFLNVLSFQPRGELLRLRERIETGYFLTIGSLTTDEFYIDQDVRIRFDVLPWFALGYRYIEAEDFDARYRRNIVWGEVGPFPLGAYLRVQSELAAAKETIDVGLGAGWRPGEAIDLSLDYILVDALFNRKASSGDRYERSPGTVRATLRTGGARHVLRAELEIDRPLRLAVADEDFVFAMERLAYRVEASGELTAAMGLLLHAAGEHARKSRDVGPTGDPAEELDLVRDHVEVRIGGNFSLPGGDEIEAGVQGFYLRERSDRPQDPAGLALLFRREATIYAGYLYRVPARISRVVLPVPARYRPEILLRPSVYVAWVDAFEETGAGAVDSTEEVQAKLDLAIEIAFRETLRVVLNPTMRIDDPQFGGGNVQVVLAF